MADDAAPAQECMDGGEGGGLAGIVGPMKGMLVKQTARGCLQECMGCEAKSEFQISDFEPSMTDGVFLTDGATDKPNALYALEQSSCCCRLCWRDGRPFDMPVTAGGEAGGAAIVNFKKPCGFPVVCVIPLGENGNVEVPCCCMLPELTAYTQDGRELSKTKYQCDACLYVPKLMYQENKNGAFEDVYKIRPETCCGGCCIMIKCSGKGCCSVPFLLWDAKTGEKVPTEFGDGEASITKVWAGLKKECCTTADNFTISFPKDITPERKIGLLGSTFLLDFTVFERQQQ